MSRFPQMTFWPASVDLRLSNICGYCHPLVEYFASGPIRKATCLSTSFVSWPTEWDGCLDGLLSDNAGARQRYAASCVFCARGHGRRWWKAFERLCVIYVICDTVPSVRGHGACCNLGFFRVQENATSDSSTEHEETESLRLIWYLSLNIPLLSVTLSDWISDTGRHESIAQKIVFDSRRGISTAFR